MDISALLLALISVLAPAVAGYLALQFAKSVLPKLDALSPVVKQIIVFVYGLAVSYLGPLVGYQFPVELAGFADPLLLQGSLIAVLSWLVHKVFAPKA